MRCELTSTRSTSQIASPQQARAHTSVNAATALPSTMVLLSLSSFSITCNKDRKRGVNTAVRSLRSAEVLLALRVPGNFGSSASTPSLNLYYIGAQHSKVCFSPAKAGAPGLDLAQKSWGWHWPHTCERTGNCRKHSHARPTARGSSPEGRNAGRDERKVRVVCKQFVHAPQVALPVHVLIASQSSS